MSKSDEMKRTLSESNESGWDKRWCEGWICGMANAGKLTDGEKWELLEWSGEVTEKK